MIKKKNTGIYLIAVIALLIIFLGSYLTYFLMNMDQKINEDKDILQNQFDEVYTRISDIENRHLLLSNNLTEQLSRYSNKNAVFMDKLMELEFSLKIISSNVDGLSSNLTEIESLIANNMDNEHEEFTSSVNDHYASLEEQIENLIIQLTELESDVEATKSNILYDEIYSSVVHLKIGSKDPDLPAAQ